MGISVPEIMKGSELEDVEFVTWYSLPGTCSSYTQFEPNRFKQSIYLSINPSLQSAVCKEQVVFPLHVQSPVAVFSCSFVVSTVISGFFFQTSYLGKASPTVSCAEVLQANQGIRDMIVKPIEGTPECKCCPLGCKRCYVLVQRSHDELQLFLNSLTCYHSRS